MRFRIITYIVLAGALATAGYALLSANEVPKAAGQAQAYWKSVEDEFRRRAEFVPAIVTAIEAINPAQKELIGKVKATQAGVMALPPNPAAPKNLDKFRAYMRVQDDLSENLGSVMDMLRIYPDKARTEPVRKVFDELELKETRIVVARSNYVTLAAQHNELLSTPPTSWLSRWLYPDSVPLVSSFDPAKQ